MNTNHRNTVGEFARSVRAQLSDLPALDVEELTEGLEADLAERLAEDGSDLGDPVDYAAELRASAGLAPKAPLPPAVPLRRSLALKARETVASLRAHPSTASLIEFLIALRPVWWVLRGWIVFGLLIVLVTQSWPLVPRNFFEFVAWVGLVGVSVQWGRGRWLGSGTAGKTMKIAMSAVAAVLMVPLLPISAYSILSNAQAAEASEYSSSPSAPGGVVNDGNPVSNVFAYDCSGEPLYNVQLFDQDGEKLAVAYSGQEYVSYYDEKMEKEEYAIPNQFFTSGDGWNIFPLDVNGADPYVEDADPGRFLAPLPFAGVQPLLNDCRPATPTVPEVLLPTTMPTAPTLDPEGVKATDAKGSESAAPTPSPTPGTPAPDESKTPKESAQPAMPSSESSGEPSKAPEDK